MAGVTQVYFTEYQPDAEIALQQLRHDIFVKGDHKAPTKLELEYLLRMSPNEQEQEVTRMRIFHDKYNIYNHPSMVNARARIEELQRRMQQIDTLFLEDDGMGTSSILDIFHASPIWIPDNEQLVHTAYPAPLGVIQMVFGTIRPTHMQVESLWEQLSPNRCTSLYFLVYAEEYPTEWCFIYTTAD